jgi:hypothetical protein
MFSHFVGLIESGRKITPDVSHSYTHDDRLPEARSMLNLIQLPMAQFWEWWDPNLPASQMLLQDSSNSKTGGKMDDAVGCVLSGVNGALAWAGLGVGRRCHCGGFDGLIFWGFRVYYLRMSV